MSYPWIFTVHALSRAAKRYGLIVDRNAELEISRLLDTAATFLKMERSAHLYEIQAFGKAMVAVCDVPERTVITFLDPVTWNRGARKRSPSRAPRRKFLKAADEEE
jgi:hypothetical protein